VPRFVDAKDAILAWMEEEVPKLKGLGFREALAKHPHVSA
jgi:hypothetical protein